MNGDTLAGVRIIIPVRNGGARWREAADALDKHLGGSVGIVVIDSESTDGSDLVARDHGFVVERIAVRTFNHGRTRQEAVSRYAAGCRIVIFLTQDAVLEDGNSLPRLLAAFDSPEVGAAYGRQLPHIAATPIGAHAALFNYPGESLTKSLADAGHLGIKTAYLSNSFAAYRTTALEQCGGFPSHLILGEDAYVAMKMILSGWSVRYCADARVRHSHDYTVLQEMERYFDFGVMHAQIPELISGFGSAEGEGGKFLFSEFEYIARVAPRKLLEVIIRNGLKYLGYRLGRNYKFVPRKMCQWMSMTKRYWGSNTDAG